jgi:hypothetical protein
MFRDFRLVKPPGQQTPKSRNINAFVTPSDSTLPEPAACALYAAMKRSPSGLVPNVPPTSALMLSSVRS